MDCKKNFIYLFYENVDIEKPTEPGAKYYRCFHSVHKIFKVTRGMKYNVKHMFWDINVRYMLC